MYSAAAGPSRSPAPQLFQTFRPLQVLRDRRQDAVHLEMQPRRISMLSAFGQPSLMATAPQAPSASMWLLASCSPASQQVAACFLQSRAPGLVAHTLAAPFAWGPNRLLSSIGSRLQASSSLCSSSMQARRVECLLHQACRLRAGSGKHLHVFVINTVEWPAMSCKSPWWVDACGVFCLSGTVVYVLVGCGGPSPIASLVTVFDPLNVTPRTNLVRILCGQREM
jgi:hypothetical protein